MTVTSRMCKCDSLVMTAPWPEAMKCLLVHADHSHGDMPLQLVALLHMG